jgi:hypothetical protein
MSNDIALRRRAIYTGLKPYLEDDALLDALMHWENHFATAPRFTLQRFVAELCKEGELRRRRADILLSLVQALSMPATSLLPDPLQHRQQAETASSDDSMALPVASRHAGKSRYPQAAQGLADGIAALAG